MSRLLQLHYIHSDKIKPPEDSILLESLVTALEIIAASLAFLDTSTTIGQNVRERLVEQGLIQYCGTYLHFSAGNSKDMSQFDDSGSQLFLLSLQVIGNLIAGCLSGQVCCRNIYLSLCSVHNVMSSQCLSERVA